ncbi:MAG: response regulator [Firmicutes bacterium]|nr:response regulator [Bacillota bacterium]
MVVDDSPFSRTILADTLQEFGYDVVGEADSLESLIQAYESGKPDIVTMDIAMPGADGFECSRALRLHDPAARIIMVSSMKDEVTETQARKIGIMGYVQKPVDGEVLDRVIKNVVAPDALFAKLDKWAPNIFKEAADQSITRMTRTTVTVRDSDEQQNSHMSQGISVVIGIIGKYAGNMILDISMEAAGKMAAAILRRKPKNKNEVLAMVGELANVVAGVACSMLNKKDKSLGLRVSPPSLFYGAPTEIISPSIKNHVFDVETDFGSVYLSVGFKKGSVLWM